jgi:electron transfer flavoprotein alpha subunit
MTTHDAILVIGETTDGEITAVTTQLMQLAKQLCRDSGKKVYLALIGHQVPAGAGKGYGYGADQVFTVTDPVLENYVADSYRQAARQLVAQLNPALVLLGHTDMGLDLAPRLAIRLKTGAATDCVDIKYDAQSDGFLYEKPVFGGKAHGLLRLTGPFPQVATIREGAIDPPAFDATATGDVQPVAVTIDPSRIRVRLVGKQKDESLALAQKLAMANIVVCAGRGVKNPEGVQLVGQTAALLGGAVAASRPAVDYGWLPYSLQVGLTGKKVAPKLYVAVGVSGAIQHMAGCLKSKTIVAVNSDENAPIFRMAHFGAVGDFQQVLAGLNDELQKSGK